MALTAELVALCHRTEPDLGLPAYLTPIADGDFEKYADAPCSNAGPARSGSSPTDR